MYLALPNSTKISGNFVEKYHNKTRDYIILWMKRNTTHHSRSAHSNSPHHRSERQRARQFFSRNPTIK